MGRRLKQLVCAPAMETDTATGSCSKLKRYDWIGFALNDRAQSRANRKWANLTDLSDKGLDPIIRITV